MEITRFIPGMASTEPFRFKLTPDELEKAYREQEKNYRLMDARIQLKEFFDANYPEEPVTQDFKEPQAFKNAFGFTFEEAVDPDSENYILEALQNAFEDEQDCNCAENDIWQSTIEDYISEFNAGDRVIFTVKVIGSDLKLSLYRTDNYKLCSKFLTDWSLCGHDELLEVTRENKPAKEGDANE